MKSGKSTSTEPPSDPRPREFIANSTAEFMALVARDRAGEFVTAQWIVGATQSQWIFKVWYPSRPFVQQKLSI